MPSDSKRPVKACQVNSVFVRPSCCTTPASVRSTVCRNCIWGLVRHARSCRRRSLRKTKNQRNPKMSSHGVNCITRSVMGTGVAGGAGVAGVLLPR